MRLYHIYRNFEVLLLHVAKTFIFAWTPSVNALPPEKYFLEDAKNIPGRGEASFVGGGQSILIQTRWEGGGDELHS